MAPDAQETELSRTFQLTCTDCSFQAAVEGTVDDALDVAEDHQENRGDGGAIDHFVDFELHRDGG